MFSTNIGKLNNQEKILELLRFEPGLTKQEIAHKLSLSMPTLLQNIKEMLEKEILEICGTTASTGGRKAQKIQLKGDIGFCVGIDIAVNFIHFCLIDFCGKIITIQKIKIKFCDTTSCYEEIATALHNFLANQQISSDKILGVGISFPGIVDSESKTLLRSHIFNLENISLDRFERNLPYPLIIANDANCASYTELNSEHKDYFYISLNETVGGALVIERALMSGSKFQTGEIGHMLLVPDGLACYCGKNGCADAYLSPKVLISQAESLDDFFHHLQIKNPHLIQAWDSYLNYLAILISNMRMILDIDIIIGGEMSLYIEYYIEELRKKISNYDYFARDIDYIFTSSQKKSACSIGAAILALEQFSHRIL